MSSLKDFRFPIELCCRAASVKPFDDDGKHGGVVRGAGLVYLALLLVTDSELGRERLNYGFSEA
jgi:hypothetical protein